MNLEPRVIKLERTMQTQTQTQVVRILRFSFAEEDAIGATVRKDNLLLNVPRLPDESVKDLIERAINSVPQGGCVAVWLYA